MIPVPSGMRVWLAVGRTDMRRGMNGLALQVQETLGRDPFAGDLFVFRGARGDLIKILWHDGLGLSLYAKRLERGRFVWPSASTAPSRFRPRSSPTCSTGSTGVTRFTHSGRNARDRPSRRAYFAGGNRGSVIPLWDGFAARRYRDTEGRAGGGPRQGGRRCGDDRAAEAVCLACTRQCQNCKGSSHSRCRRPTHHRRR